MATLDQRTAPATDDASTARFARDLWHDIERLDLADHVAELETKGLTVVPPGKAAPPELIEQLRQACFRVARKRRGRGYDPDANAKAGSSPFGGGIGAVLSYLLVEDRAFQEIVCTPVVSTLTDHLLGERAIIGTCMAQFKAPDAVEVALHTDNYLMPPPFPATAYWGNATWALTDYTEDAGPLVYVPGSHRLCRHPEPGTSLASAVPVLADAGSLIFWHGNTWHGATARTAAGARMSLQVTMCRPFIRPQEMYREHLPDEVIDANPPRFAALVGRHFYGWTEQGGDGTRIVRDGPRSSYE